MSETMNSLERTRTVLAGAIPDRVPVDLHNFMMLAHTSGMPFPDFFQDGAAMAEAHIQAWREFGHDVILVENGTAALAEACGCHVEYLEESAPVAHGAAIKSLDEIDKLVVPDPFKVHPLKENLKATKILVDELGDKAFIMGRADQGPFSLASMILGMDLFLLELDYKVNMPRVKELVRGQATVLGPIDPSGVMALGTPAMVTDAAREAIEVLGEGGGLILGPGCALPPKTPAENIHALMEAAREFGHYR